MKKMKLEVSEEQRLLLKEMRDALAGVTVDGFGGISFTEETGGCGGLCRITCAYYCRDNCEDTCRDGCNTGCKYSSHVIDFCLFWKTVPWMT